MNPPKNGRFLQKGRHTMTKYYYYLDCLDGVLGDTYLTAEELNQLQNGSAEPMTEREIIKTAANYEAALYRYEKTTDGEFINGVCIYDPEG